MGRSASARKKAPRKTLLHHGAAAIGETIARNPVLVGGSTAFLVALSFVSANALWYQPHFHKGAFFVTRDVEKDYVAPQHDRNLGSLEAGEQAATIRFERPEPVPEPRPQGRMANVQQALKQIGFYDGEIDGLEGPHTRQAIERYQKTVGLPVSGVVDDALLEQLGAQPTGALPVPRPRDSANAGQQQVSAGRPGRNDTIAKIQAGLKAFGNEGIEVDGLMGAKTRSGIEEFQALFGLPVTGEPDPAVYAKMREIGLTD